MRRPLYVVRNKSGLSQASVARIAGISRPYYLQIEAGKRTPSIQVAFRIAAVLDADPRELFADLSENQAAPERAEGGR